MIERIWYQTSPVWVKPLEIPLAIASYCYRFGLYLDQSKKKSRVRSLPRPVLSVGNLTVGGTGKTPVVCFLAEQAQALGKNVAILSRGYGTQAQEPLMVPSQSNHWEQFGDEPTMLASSLPGCQVWVGRDRYALGIKAIETNNEIDLFLLDDGFQHRQLARDVDLVLLDGGRGLGNHRVLPWGPLREPEAALQRADHLAVVFKSGGQDSSRPSSDSDPNSFEVEIGPKSWSYLGEGWRRSLAELPLNKPVHLISGIGSPESFEQTVRSCGMEIQNHTVFPDHHPFKPADIEPLIRESDQEECSIVTTEKDAIRLRDLPVVWTESNRPIMIQIGLFTGDGADRLKDIVKSVFKNSDSGETKISGGRTSS